MTHSDIEHATPKARRTPSPPWETGEDWETSEGEPAGRDWAAAYGDMTRVRILKYWKYQFTLLVLTSRGYKLRATAGGDKDDIYRYDPMSLRWDDHPLLQVESVLAAPDRD